MKISINHAKEFVEQYKLASGVTLAEQDVMRCLEYVFAETVPATPEPQSPRLTEESIRKMIEKYMDKYTDKPIQPLPYGVYAYMCSFPGSSYPNKGYCTSGFTNVTAESNHNVVTINKTDKE